ncbi:hypothetical protein BDR05DRAFT_978902 [Suillus weaverae]|nr:hypothetical protein BDR05DRAFT_978902 [Suillus weaverae]
MGSAVGMHDNFVGFPHPDSEDAELAWQYAESKTCPEWRNGILAVEGTTIDLYAKPAHFGETFYDRKSNYSLGCQAAVMPHNLIIVDYALGHPGSHEALLPDDHWIWADSAYPLEKWCIVPFKKPRNGMLTKDQKTFNYHLSTVCVRVEHAFAALKGRFQSL